MLATTVQGLAKNLKSLYSKLVSLNVKHQQSNHNRNLPVRLSETRHLEPRDQSAS